ncbi:hypothetical protein JCM8547_006960 [Rhodosporidiobolus lusitaniae]
MPRTGSVTPPTARTPPLHSASPPATAADQADPFLRQATRLSLTEQDRQEGYDVELLNARPRGGRYSVDEGSDNGAAGEKYGGGALAPVHSSGGPAGLHNGGMGPVAAGMGAGGALLGVGRAGLGGGLGGGAGGAAAGGPGDAALSAKEYGSAHPAGSGTTARSGRRKPWFLRPLPLGILAGTLIAIALAVGLGVGLSTRHSSSDKSSNSTTTASGLRSISTRTRTGTATDTGTVIPSSLYSSIVSEHPELTATSSEATETSTSSGDDTPESTSDLSSITTVPSPSSTTALATTSNVPIPAASYTVVDGTTYSALTTASGGTTAASLATVTARARVRRRYEWRA